MIQLRIRNEKKKPISNNAICPLFMRIVFFNTNGTCIILIISVCMLRVLICLYVYKQIYYTAINCAPKMMAWHLNLKLRNCWTHYVFNNLLKKLHRLKRACNAISAVYVMFYKRRHLVTYLFKYFTSYLHRAITP